MSIAPATLFHGTIANGAPATVYTVPTGQSFVIRRLLVVGVVGASVTVNVNGQPVIFTEPVAANRRLEQLLEYRIDEGDTITAGAGAVGIVLLVTALSL